MKIVDRATFLAMPIGTVYCKYSPCHLDSFEIKSSTASLEDFYAQAIENSIATRIGEDVSDVLLEAQEHGTTFRLDLECQYRDGLLDQDQLFVVWDNEDVLTLIRRLTFALENKE